MWYRITVAQDYLRADLFERETAEDTREFLVAVGAAAREHGRTQVLICVHASRAIFKVQQYGIFECFKELSAVSRYRIALIADSDELRLSHQYVEALARQNAINLRSFRNEHEALNWFGDRRWSSDRRRRQEPPAGTERRRIERRRQPFDALEHDSGADFAPVGE